MFHMFLTVLKILGIILFIILGLVLLAILSILFIPIRYVGQFFYTSSPDILFRIKWLFPLVYVSIKHQVKTQVIVRILGITLYRSDKIKGKKKKHPAEAKNNNQEKQTRNPITATLEKRRKRRFAEWAYNLWYTIKGFCAKLRQTQGVLEKYVSIWKSDSFSSVRKYVCQQISYLLNALRPKKLEGQIAFGFQDPSLTGYVMSVYGIFYPLWGNTVTVKPDFEQSCFDARLFVKGKVRMIHIFIVCLKLYLNHDIRDTISLVKKEI